MLTVEARAKINLTLDILGKRPDNFHEVKMVMQQIELSDRLHFREEPKGSGIRVVGDIPGLVSPERNLAYRAAKLMADEFHIRQGIFIELTKRIPVAAGLAGGSADAAAVIVAMNRMFHLGLHIKELCALGARIGSDVAFCIAGKTMLATGRGEILSPLAAMPACHVVLVKPQFHVSTAWAYQNYRAEHVKSRPDTEGMIAALERGDLTAVGQLLCNVLESVTIGRYADIGIIKARMLDLGAMASLMSGSGPTVFALTPDEKQAKRIAEKMRQLKKAQVLLTKTVSGD